MSAATAASQYGLNPDVCGKLQMKVTTSSNNVGMASFTVLCDCADEIDHVIVLCSSILHCTSLLLLKR